MGNYKILGWGRTSRAKTIGLSLCFFLGSALAKAAPLFEYSLVASGPGAPPPLTRGFTSYGDVINFSDTFDFSAFNSFATVETVGLFGQSGAILRQENAAGNLVQISSPVTGVVRTFSGPNAVADADAYTDSDLGASDLLAVLSALVKRSPVTQVDGTPTAQTASSAQTIFNHFGFDSFTGVDFAAMEGASVSDDAGGGGWLGLGLYVDRSRFTVDLPGGVEVDGTDSKISVPISFKFGSRVSLRAGVGVAYTDIEGSKTFGTNLYAGLPIKLAVFSADQKWQWKVTPFAGLAESGSEDKVFGSGTYQIGATNLIEFRLHPNLIVSLASQASSHETMDVLADRYDFAVPVSQQILKNGLRLRWRTSPRWILETFAIDSRFLKDAAVEDYQTYGAGASFQLTKRWWAGLNYKIESGNNYDGWNAGFSSGWNF